MVRRLENWPRLLGEYLHAQRDTTFKWGETDCVMLAAGAVQAMTGTELTLAMRGYTDEASAQELLAAHGGLECLITEALNVTPHTNWKKARRGDVALTWQQEGAAVVDSSGQALAAMTKAGLVRLPLSRAILIWSW